MKSTRIFYTTAASLILLITVVGFFPYYARGQGEGGRIIAPDIFLTVLVHGLSITAWYVLSLAQSLLIAGSNRRFHMKLGWAAVGLLPVVTVSGVLVAVRSAQGAPGFIFFGMNYQVEFLLVMLTEIAVFTVLVVAGLALRKQPEKHRAMMLAASLSLLLGATTRIPSLVALFGGHDSRVAFFGPVFCLAVLLVLVRSVMTRTVDRWLAAGCGFMIISYLAAEQLSRSAAWHQLAEALLKS